MVPRMKNVTERRFSTGLWMADSTSIVEAAIKRHGEKRTMDRLNATEPIVPQQFTSDYRFMAIINFPTFDPVSKLSERGRWCSGCMGPRSSRYQKRIFLRAEFHHHLQTYWPIHRNANGDGYHHGHRWVDDEDCAGFVLHLCSEGFDECDRDRCDYFWTGKYV